MNKRAYSSVGYDDWSWMWTFTYISLFIVVFCLWPGYFWWWCWIFLFFILFDVFFAYWPSNVYVDDDYVYSNRRRNKKQYQLSQVASVETQPLKKGKNGLLILHMKDGSTAQLKCKDPDAIAGAIRKNLA